MNSINNAAVAAFAIATGLAFAAPAAAQPEVSANVPYADLNLASEAGRAVLDSRIGHAVEQVCGKTTGKPGMDASIRKCQRETMAIANKSRDIAVAEYGDARLAARTDKVIRLVVR